MSVLRERSVRRATVLAAEVFVLVFLVALGSSRSSDRLGGAGHVLAGRLIVGDLTVVFVVLGVVVTGVIAYLVLTTRDAEADEEAEEKKAWWKKLLALAFVAMVPVLFLAQMVLGWRFLHHRGHGSSPVGLATSPFAHLRHSGATSAGRGGAGFVVHWWLLLGLLIVVVVAVAVVAAFVLIRERGLRAEGEQARGSDGLRAVIEESLAELERDRDSRRAVIRAYVGMEQALSRRGFGRRPFEAPLEYLARALTAMRVSRPAGERLTALFAQARFSEHPVDFEMKRDAIAALAAVRDELAEEQAG